MTADTNTDICPHCGADWCFEEHEPWPTCETCVWRQDIDWFRPGFYRCGRSSLGVYAGDFCSRYSPAEGRG